MANTPRDQKPKPVRLNQPVRPPEFLDPALEKALEDEQAKDSFVHAYAEHDDISVACSYAGISRGKFRQLMALDPGFAERVQDAHEASLDQVESALKDIALCKDNPAGARVQAAKVLLEAGRPEYRKASDTSAHVNATINVFFAPDPNKRTPAPGLPSGDDIIDGVVTDG